MPKQQVEAGQNTPYPVDQFTQLALTRYEDDEMGRALVQLEDRSGLRADEWTETFDLLSGRTVEVRGAACGLGCKCGAEIRLVQK